MFSTELRKVARNYRRNVCEFFGNTRYSMTAPYEIDKKLSNYLPQSGFFIEVGANDGVSESNTYYLEKIKSWQGVLIEPIPHLFRQCVVARPQAKVFNAALVSADYSETTVVMQNRHLMSVVKGVFSNPEEDKQNLEKAKHYHNIDNAEIHVPARTLTSILDEANAPQIDFFSLDVEGFELNVLKGLDFQRYRPEYMLIECWNDVAREQIEAYILPMYQFVDKLSPRDYLYKVNEKY
jgi:FkbM family methyltransferase